MKGGSSRDGEFGDITIRRQSRIDILRQFRGIWGYFDVREQFLCTRARGTVRRHPDT